MPVRVQFSKSTVFKMCRQKMCRFRVNAVLDIAASFLGNGALRAEILTLKAQTPGKRLGLLVHNIVNLNPIERCPIDLKERVRHKIEKPKT